MRIGMCYGAIPLATHTHTEVIEFGLNYIYSVFGKIVRDSSIRLGGPAVFEFLILTSVGHLFLFLIYAVRTHQKVWG